MPLEPIIADGFSPLIAGRHIIVACIAGDIFDIESAAKMTPGRATSPLHIASMVRSSFHNSKSPFASEEKERPLAGL
jgi:hypothetical protein